jgi:hypothetical protein
MNGILTFHDGQSEMRMLDDTRRYYIKREPLLAAVRVRIGEMIAERDRLDERVLTGLKKYDVPKEKGLVRLAQIQPYEQMNDELRDLVVAHNTSKTLSLVLSGYESLLSIASSEICTGIGTIVSKLEHGDTDIGISAGEFRSIFTVFDPKAFAASLDRDYPAPATMGVATAMRAQSPGQMLGGYAPEVTVGVDSLKE